MAESVDNRRTSEKLMLARGYTWVTIKETLKLTDKMVRDDKASIEKEKGDTIADEDIVKTYMWYKGLSLQVIEDLQVAADGSDSTSGTVSALRSKEQVAKNIIVVAQEMGILPKVAEKTEHEGTHNVTFRVEDKSSIIDLIAKHIGGKESE